MILTVIVCGNLESIIHDTTQETNFFCR
jgi:hypothetical protein